MKKNGILPAVVAVFLSISFVLSGPALKAQEDWENPQMVEINKLDPHVNVIPYNTIQKAVKKKFESSP